MNSNYDFFNEDNNLKEILEQFESSEFENNTIKNYNFNNNQSNECFKDKNLNNQEKSNQFELLHDEYIEELLKKDNLISISTCNSLDKNENQQLNINTNNNILSEKNNFEFTQDLINNCNNKKLLNGEFIYKKHSSNTKYNKKSSLNINHCNKNTEINNYLNYESNKSLILTNEICIDNENKKKLKQSFFNNFNSNDENKSFLVENVNINEKNFKRPRDMMEDYNLESVSDSLCLFSTGNGKKININQDNLNKAKQMIGDNCNLELENDNLSLFSTGNGKKININQDNLNKAKQMIDDDCNLRLESDNLCLFSIGNGMKVNINQDNLNKTKQMTNDNCSLRLENDNLCLFSTGNGKKININQDNLNKAKQIIDDNYNLELENNNLSLFSTGNGKKININQDNLNKAKQMIDDNCNLELENDNLCLFSTGNGKKVNINQNNLNKAKQIIDDNYNLELENNNLSLFSTVNNKKFNINQDNLNKIKQTIDNNYSLNNTIINKNFKNNKNNLNIKDHNKYTLNQIKLSKEDIIIPNFFNNYINLKYSEIYKKYNIFSPTNILLNPTIECLKKYIYILKKNSKDNLKEYIIINYTSIYNEIELFFIKFPIFPKSLFHLKSKWFEIQYLLILYDECLKWTKIINNKIKKLINNEKNKYSNNLKNYLNKIIYEMEYPSIQKILHRLCKRAIYEFFDAKRSSIVKICEGDFTVSAPLNVKILNYIDNEFIDEKGIKQLKRIFLCTDGWYIIKIHVILSNIKINDKIITKNIFICGGNWLNSNIEFGHPLEIQSSNLDFPNLFYGINLIRPLKNNNKIKLGFYLKPIYFKICNLINSYENYINIKNYKNNSITLDTGGGLVFLIKVIVIHIFPICYKEYIENNEDNEYKNIYITRDQNEMEIFINNNEIYEINKENSNTNLIDLKDDDISKEIYNRKFILDSKMLVLDYWKFMNIKKENKKQIYISDLINNCSILTLPNGINIDDITNIKPGTIIKLSWMKITKFKFQENLNISFSKLLSTPKTSIDIKRRIKDDIIFDKVIDMINKPVLLLDNNPENIIQLKGGWPINILGIILQIYPIEERKRNFQHCFEFKVLILSPIGSKIFLRIHTLGFNKSELRMCEKIYFKLKKSFDKLKNIIDYRQFIILVENAEFNLYERSTDLYYFNIKIPYSIFKIPYYSGIEYFSCKRTQDMLYKKIKNLSYYTNCDLPLFFKNNNDEIKNFPICGNCENYLNNCICIINHLENL